MLVDSVKWFFKPDSVFATERLAKGEWEVIPSLLKTLSKEPFLLHREFILQVSRVKNCSSLRIRLAWRFLVPGGVFPYDPRLFHRFMRRCLK